MNTQYAYGAIGLRVPVFLYSNHTKVIPFDAIWSTHCGTLILEIGYSVHLNYQVKFKLTIHITH
jgi:hypothetical protein